MPHDETHIHELADRIISKPGRAARKPVDPRAESPVASEYDQRIAKLQEFIGDVDNARQKVDGLKGYIHFATKAKLGRDLVLVDTDADSPLRFDLADAITQLCADPSRKPVNVAIRDALKRGHPELVPLFHAVDDELVKMARTLCEEPRTEYRAKHEWRTPLGAASTSGIREAITRLEEMIAAVTDAQKPERKPKYWWAPKAKELLTKHPEWSDAKIAKECGIGKSALSRCKEYQECAKRIRASSTQTIPRGRKEHGQIEALDTDE